MRNEFYINGLCAHVAYGLILARGAIDSILRPADPKPFVQNEVRREDGVRVVLLNPKIAKREFTIEVALVASDWAQFVQRRDRLLTELRSGVVSLSTRYTNDIYRCVFLGCTTFQTFNGRLSKFTLKFLEMNPNDR